MRGADRKALAQSRGLGSAVDEYLHVEMVCGSENKGLHTLALERRVPRSEPFGADLCVRGGVRFGSGDLMVRRSGYKKDQNYGWSRSGRNPFWASTKGDLMDV